MILDFCVKTRTRFSLRDKRLFEIIEVEITRVDCNLNQVWFNFCRFIGTFQGNKSGRLESLSSIHFKKVDDIERTCYYNDNSVLFRLTGFI